MQKPEIYSLEVEHVEMLLIHSHTPIDTLKSNSLFSNRIAFFCFFLTTNAFCSDCKYCDTC